MSGCLKWEGHSVLEAKFCLKHTHLGEAPAVFAFEDVRVVDRTHHRDGQFGHVVGSHGAVEGRGQIGDLQPLADTSDAAHVCLDDVDGVGLQIFGKLMPRI